jgi:T4-like virus tail tube protein gp19
MVEHHPQAGHRPEHGPMAVREVVLKEGPDRARVDGTIELLDDDGNTIATYRFKQGWPVRYSGAARGPAGDEAAREEVEICHEGLERVRR